MGAWVALATYTMLGDVDPELLPSTTLISFCGGTVYTIPSSLLRLSALLLWLNVVHATWDGPRQVSWTL